MTEVIKKYSITEISKMDRENRELVNTYSAVRIKVGLELARRLKTFDDGDLYKKLDEQSYPDFPSYLKSLNINYKTAREIIGIYETYVLAAGKTIDELAEIGYHKLTIGKPQFFGKENGQYKLLKPRDELDTWLEEAKSDITQEDLMQKRREEEVGDHTHNWQRFAYQMCTLCKLKERVYEKTKEEGIA